MMLGPVSVSSKISPYHIANKSLLLFYRYSFFFSNYIFSLK